MDAHLTLLTSQPAVYFFGRNFDHQSRAATFRLAQERWVSNVAAATTSSLQICIWDRPFHAGPSVRYYGVNFRW